MTFNRANNIIHIDVGQQNDKNAHENRNKIFF